MPKLIKHLNGHSGCILSLYKDNDTLYIRKQSPDKKYNLRLKKQCIKQENFISSSNIVSAPKVLNKGYINDLFFFDMEYINAKTLAEYSYNIQINEITHLIRLLIENLHKQNNESNKIVQLIFNKKIEELKNKINKNKNIKIAFKELENYNWENITKTPCHGDLTLENILITEDKKIYLIDFLDSFYNSYLIDIAKLLQDLELGWSFRYEEENSTRNIRLFAAKNALKRAIMSMANDDKRTGGGILNDIYHILLLNMLRIYPYVHDTKTKSFLDKSVIKVLNLIEKRG